MENQTSKTIVKEVNKKLLFSDDYIKSKNCYKWMVSQINDKGKIHTLKKIEELLNQKIELEIYHSYCIGKSQAKTTKHIYVTEALLNKGVYEAADLANLCTLSNEYKNIEKALKDLKNTLYDSVIDTPNETIISTIFEIYCNCNYEMIKIALYMGYYSDIDVFIENEPESLFWDSNLNSSKETIGKKLKYCRKSVQLTQKELAEKLNINYAALLRIETGNVMPTLQTILKYCDYFKVDLYSIIDESVNGEMFAHLINNTYFKGDAIA